MYIICKECKKKLSGSFYALDAIDRYYEKLGSNIIWGCVDSSFEVILNSEKIKIPSKNHIVDNNDLKEFMINGA